MKSLRIVNNPPADAPSCMTVAGGLSPEQVLVAQRMRSVKAELRRVESEERREELRREWLDLERERDEAWRRKMHALGHEV